MTTAVIHPQGSSGTIHPYIEVRAGVIGGEPVIAGTRIGVRLSAGWHRMGQSVDEIVAMYPHLNHCPLARRDFIVYLAHYKSGLTQPSLRAAVWRSNRHAV